MVLRLHDSLGFISCLVTNATLRQIVSGHGHLATVGQTWAASLSGDVRLWLGAIAMCTISPWQCELNHVQLVSMCTNATHVMLKKSIQVYHLVSHP